MSGLDATDAGAILRSLGLVVPPPPPAVADYEPYSVVGSIVYTSGQLPWEGETLAFTGKIGRDLTPEQGYQACRLSALLGISQIVAAAGSLENIERIIRLEGILNVAPGFTQTPAVLDGASHLINRVFGDKGRHSRSIATNPELPFDCACLVYLWAEIR